MKRATTTTKTKGTQSWWKSIWKVFTQYS